MSSDFSYRLIVVVSMVCLLIVFSSVDDQFCTTIVAMAIGKDEAHNCFEYWFNRYQGLIGALATLAAAIVAYRAVRWQVKQGERSASKRDDREAHAARAVLPLSLSAICEYAIDCMRRLDKTKTSDSAVQPWPVYVPPVFPNTVIAPLQDAVRTSDQHIAKEIADLITISQIQLSRTKGLITELESISGAKLRNYMIESAIFDAAVIHARASALFEYARGDFAGVGSTSAGIRAAFVISSVIIENHPVVEKRIKTIEEDEKGDQSKLV